MNRVNVGFDTLFYFGFAPTRIVSRVLDSGAGYSMVEFLPGGSWMELYFTPGSGSYKEDSVRDASGVSWRSSFSIRCLRDTAPEWLQLDTLVREPGIVRLGFKGGYRIFGTMSLPVRLNAQLDTANGRHIVLSAEYRSVGLSKWER